ncbi:MAG: DsbA family protein [Candidatus Woesearchaeota archaeon]
MAKKHSGHKTKKKHASHTHKAAKHNHDEQAKTHKGHGHEERQHRAKKTSTGSNESIKNAAIVVLSLALIAVLVWAFTNGDVPDKEGATGGVVALSGVDVDEQTLQTMKELADDDPFMGAEDAPITIVEFSDFECPFCTRFWEETLPKIKEEFVDTGLVKFVYRDLPLPQLNHRNAQKAAEAAECAHDQGAFWEYHDKLFANPDGLGTDSLKKHAADLGLDVQEFNECLDSGKHAEEVQADAEAARQQGITGTPGFVINGQTVTGAQPFDKFQQIICGIAPDSEPCADIEPPQEFTVTIVDDERCTGCDTGQVRSVTKDLFPGASFETVDASTPEGEALIEEHDLTFGPAYLFPAAVADTSSWQNQPNLKQSFIETSDGYRLDPQAVGATWYFSEEKRQEQDQKMESYPEDNLDSLGATGDKPRLDYFVMAFCPYGNPADEAASKLHDLFGDKVDIVPHYIISVSGDTIQSLHGEQEGNQGVRELCALEELGKDAFFDFTLEVNEECSSENADSCWTDAAEAAGVATEPIKECFEEHRLDYAEEQGSLLESLKTERQGQLVSPSASPTYLINGETYADGRDANSLKEALCAEFDQPPAECDEALEAATNAPDQGSC